MDHEVEEHRYFITMWWGMDPELSSASAGERGNHWETWGFPTDEAREEFLRTDMGVREGYRLLKPGTPYFLHERTDELLVGQHGEP